jgi:predicted Fe-Mo cluster-binding NifX family protein
MRIVIPTDDKKGSDADVAGHFGKCGTYTFFDENGKMLEVINNVSEHMGGQGLPPELMKKHGADILLCKDLGPRALNLCRELGIEVYVDSAKTAKELFAMWKNNKLKKATTQDVCEEHKKE